jgi:hypothetical protein
MGAPAAAVPPGGGHRPGAPANRPANVNPQMANRGRARWALQPPRAIRWAAPEQATGPAHRRIIRLMQIPR